MDSTLMQIPGYSVFEYILILNPHEALRHKIEKSRRALLDTYKIQQPFTGRPNITLVRFTATKAMEHKIINRLKQIALTEKPFMVELRNFGSYPMHAIFIRIANQPRVLQLIKNLKQTRSLMKAAGEDPHFLLDPQIALAGRISKENYLEAMKEYRDKDFSGSFLADRFLLLRRAKKDKTFDIIKHFEFENQPAAMEQGALFL